MALWVPSGRLERLAGDGVIQQNIFFRFYLSKSVLGGVFHTTFYSWNTPHAKSSAAHLAMY